MPEGAAGWEGPCLHEKITQQREVELPQSLDVLAWAPLNPLST